MRSYKIYKEQEYSGMIHVEGGSFLLNDEIECEISSFWIGQYAVSQELWTQVMGNNPAGFKGKNFPVERVSWYDAVEFCNVLSKEQSLDAVYKVDKSKKDPNNQSKYDDLKWLVEKNDSANGYRLPTEAEWEFAARGGESREGVLYSGSKKIEKAAWYRDNSHREPQQLGLKVPNELGLYGMSGNVYEWCQDWRGDYQTGPFKDPTGSKIGQARVLRGGSWINYENLCRVSLRVSYTPGYRFYYVGFRLSRTAL